MVRYRCKHVLCGLMSDSYFDLCRHKVKCLHEKRQHEDTTQSAAPDTVGCCSIQLPTLHESPSSKMNPENAESSTAMGLQTAVQQVDKDRMPKILLS